jgi:hypothetical protein
MKRMRFWNLPNSSSRTPPAGSSTRFELVSHSSCMTATDRPAMYLQPPIVFIIASVNGMPHHWDPGHTKQETKTLRTRTRSANSGSGQRSICGCIGDFITISYYVSWRAFRGKRKDDFSQLRPSNESGFNHSSVTSRRNRPRLDHSPNPTGGQNASIWSLEKSIKEKS